MNPAPSKTGSDSTREEVTRLFEQYIAAWNARDFHKIGGEIYQPPILVYDPNGNTQLASAEQIAGLLQGLRAELDAAGFDHSVLRDVSVRDLGDGLAFASFYYSRIDRAGAAMERDVLASAYIVRKTPTGWRLVAHITQST